MEGRSSGEKSTSVASGGGTPNKGRNVIQSLQLIRGVVPGMPTAVLVSLAKSFQKLVSYKVFRSTKMILAKISAPQAKF